MGLPTPVLDSHTGQEIWSGYSLVLTSSWTDEKCFDWFWHRNVEDPQLPHYVTKGRLRCDRFGGGSVIWTGISMEGCLPMLAWPKSSTTPLGHVRCVMYCLCCQVVLQIVQKLSDALVVIWEEIPRTPSVVFRFFFFTLNFWLYLNLVLYRLKNHFH